MTAPRDTPAPRKPGSKAGRRPGTALGPESGARAIAAARKQAEALRLRESGMDLREIAEELGYADASGAFRIIQAGLRAMLPEETRDEYRRLELARLDALQEATWPRALAGDPKAAGIALRCISMRSRLLGLEAPIQVDARPRAGEPVRVEILDVLSEEMLESLRPLQDEMVRLSELRAGVIPDAPGSVSHR